MNASPSSPGAGLLPGGLLTDGGLARDYAFAPADGLLELTVSEVAAAAASMPQAVSLALAAALRQLAGGAPTRERVDALCVADRQFLMRQLACHLGDEGGWFHAACAACGSRFDFQLAYADLPVRPAGPGYPYARIECGNRPLVLRVPTGADQLRLLAACGPDAEAALLQGLLASPPPPDAPELALADPQEWRRIESALEQAAPAVCTAVAARCPDCRHVNEVDVDPYGVLARPADALLDEVHRLAWSYHWSEPDILRLPRARRRQYLQRIDRQRGLRQ